MAKGYRAGFKVALVAELGDHLGGLKELLKNENILRFRRIDFVDTIQDSSKSVYKN